MKKNKTEIEQVEDFLKKEGFTEITDNEKNSSEYKDSLSKIYSMNNKQHEVSKRKAL